MVLFFFPSSFFTMALISFGDDHQCSKKQQSAVNIASVRMVQDRLFRVFRVAGVGSGVIIDENGHILTNIHHVGNRYNIYTSPTALYQKAEETEFADCILS
jgi:S1-C subfamily serine protease